MKIKSWLNAFKYVKFKFGEQTVSQFILFECKFLFSIIFFYFHESEGSQDRFHTHAFKALSIRIFGDYEEEFINEEKQITCSPRRRSRFIYIPRNHYHRIARSKKCLTMVLCGPWYKTWKEYRDGVETQYSWGRKTK
jgi:hypothetical protein